MIGRRISSFAVGCGFAIAALAGRATVGAQLLTFEARGTVTDVDTVLNSPADWPAVGTPVVATFTCDSGATPNSLGRLIGGVLHVVIGDRNWEGTGFEIVSAKSATGGTDVYEVDTSRDLYLLPPNDQVREVEFWNFYLDAYGTGMLSDAAGGLPLPDVSRAQRATMVVWGDNVNNASPVAIVGLNASLDSVTLVPDPAALPALGIAALLLLRRRR